MTPRRVVVLALAHVLTFAAACGATYLIGTHKNRRTTT